MATKRHRKKVDEADISVRKFGKIVKKLKIADDCVIVIRANTPMSTKESIEAFSKSIANAGYKGIIAIVVDELDDIGSLNVDEMGKHGWFKFKDAAAALMNKLIEKDKENDAEEQEEKNRI